MEKFAKTFAGGVNRDSEELFFPEGDWSDSLDFDPGPGNTGEFTRGSGQGMIIPASIYSSENEKVVGFAEDRENGRVYFLIAAAVPKIVEYTKSTGLHQEICQGAALGFNNDTIINGATVIDSHLIWNDAVNLVGHIHVPSMKAGKYTTPVVNGEIRLVKRPPMYPLICRLSVQSGVPRNFISSETFVFSYRYEYETGMMSVPAPWSAPVYRNPDYGVESFNRIDILVDDREVTPKTVVNVQLLVMKPNDIGFFIFKQLTRDQFVNTLGQESATSSDEQQSSNE